MDVEELLEVVVDEAGCCEVGSDGGALALPLSPAPSSPDGGTLPPSPGEPPRDPPPLPGPRLFFTPPPGPSCWPPDAAGAPVEDEASASVGLA